MKKQGERVADDDRKVGLRLREVRKGLHMTLEQFASAMEVTIQQLHKYERGHNRVSAGRVARAVRELNIPLALLFDASEDENPLITAGVDLAVTAADEDTLRTLREMAPLLRGLDGEAHALALKLVRTVHDQRGKA